MRGALRSARKALTAEARSSAAALLRERVLGLPVWETADIVAAYRPCGSEIDVLPLAAAALAAGKGLLFPTVAGEGMVWRQAPGLEEGLFRPGAHGILEPAPDLPEHSLREGEKVLFLVPGVGFDRACRRLGQGGGYYDRMLEKFSAAGRRWPFFLGVAFDCQLADLIPADPWDRGVDAVITPGFYLAAIDIDSRS